MSTPRLHSLPDIVLFPHLNDHHSPSNLHGLGVVRSHRHLHPFFLDQSAEFGLVVENVESPIIKLDECMVP